MLYLDLLWLGHEVMPLQLLILDIECQPRSDTRNQKDEMEA